MINPEHLKKYVIEPTLEELDLYSTAAENLLLGTAAKESKMGYYLHQIGGGPALGLYQMEPNTCKCIINNYLNYRYDLSVKVCKMFNVDNLDQLLSLSNNIMWDLKLATVMCRLHYLRVSEKLPGANDIESMARYWKKYYNTYLGAYSFDVAVKKYCESFNKYVSNVNV